MQRCNLILYGLLFAVGDLPDEQILNGNQPDMDDCVASENQEEEVVAMVEESPSGIILIAQYLSYYLLGLRDSYLFSPLFPFVCIFHFIAAKFLFYRGVENTTFSQ